MQAPTNSTRHASARALAALCVLIVVAPTALPRSAHATEFDLASIPDADLGFAPIALACADLDGDGRADLVTVEPGGPAVRIRRGLGGATFAAQPAIPLPAAAGGIEAADLDQDGDVDLSIALPTLGVGILANDGAGGLSLPTILPLPHASRVLFVRDLDGDGIVDVLALGASTPDASLLSGAGGGAFLAPIPIALGVAPTDACLGDLDSDGDLDLVLSNGPSGVVARLVNLGGGAFSAPTLTPLAGTQEIELADADDDGDLDLVTTFTWVDALAVLANDGSGSFGAATFATGLPVNCWGLARGDFDGDGRDDVALGADGAAQVRLGPLGPTARIDVATPGAFLVRPLATDLDQDLDEDVVGLDVGGARIVILRNARTSGAAVCLGDGLAANCPCGNDAPVGALAGCTNSSGSAGTLRATGRAALSADGVRLVTQGTGASPVLFAQGTSALAGGQGAPFGDGVRCIGGTIVRIAIRPATAGSATYPNAMDPPLSTAGGVVSPGTRFVQTWYRDAAPFCTSATFNLTNGIEIVWLP